MLISLLRSNISREKEVILGILLFPVVRFMLKRIYQMKTENTLILVRWISESCNKNLEYKVIASS